MPVSLTVHMSVSGRLGAVRWCRRASTTTTAAAGVAASRAATKASEAASHAASQASEAASQASKRAKQRTWSMMTRAQIAVYGAGTAAALYLGYLYTTDTRASVHQWLVPRLVRLVYDDAEDAHHAGTATLKTLYQFGLHPRERVGSVAPGQLKVGVWETQLDNPIGISAGLDKDGEIADALFALGAGVVEIGGCTPLAQAGNERPRVFRIGALEALVNRYGLNSRGSDHVAMQLRHRVRTFAQRLGMEEQEVLDGEAGVPPGSLQAGRLLAVQVAKNKETDERDAAAVAADYVYCVKRLAPYADVVVVNVSSPNTPGLRQLQATEPLTRLLRAVVDEAARTQRRVRPRVMVKVSPDEDEDAQVAGVVQAVQASGVDGIIVGNTTKRRAGLVPPGIQLTRQEQRALMEQGGFSGPAMFDRTLQLVRRYRQLLDLHRHGEEEQKVIFASGGITNGRQALAVLQAGASVAMVYTALVYGGAGTVTRMKQELKACMDGRED